MTFSCPVCWHRFKTDAATEVICPVCDEPVAAQAIDSTPEPVATIAKPIKHQRKNLWTRFGLVLLIVFGGGLLVCAGIGYAIWDYVTQPEFVHHIDTEGKFTIDFPHRPFRARPVTWGHDGMASFPIVGCERPWPDEAYFIAWRDLEEEDLVLGTDAILSEVVNSSQLFNPFLDGELRRDRFDYHGHPAIEAVTAAKHSAGKGIVRAIIVGNRLYVLSVAGGWIQDDSVRAKSFLNSLLIQ